MQKSVQPLPKSIKRTAILLTLGISLHNFPEGIATFVTASSNTELGFGIALAVALHNIPEGLAVAGPVYAATGSKRTAILWAGISGLAEILGGVLAWLILGSMISPVVMAAIMAAVAGIMVALSVDELMPLAKEIDPNNNPSYGVLCGMSVMGFSLVLLQTAGWLKTTSEVVQHMDNFCQLHESLILPFRLSLLSYCLSICSALQAVRLCLAKRPTITFQMQEITHHNQSNQYNPVPGDKHPFTLNI